MTMGEAIREYRRESGLSQREVAERLHVDRSLIAKVEHGMPLAETHDARLARMSWRLALEIADERTGGWLSNILHEVPNLDLHPAALKDIMRRQLREALEALDDLMTANHIDREKMRKQAEKTWHEIRDVLEHGMVIQGVLEEVFELDRDRLLKQHQQELKEGKR